jgi:Arc/MetJ-type ribon-helix-helix transcriptional regulator
VNVPDSGPEGLADRIEARAAELRAEAVLTMTDLAGPTSACSLARDGRPFPAYKLHEGRYAAASEVVRALREELAGEARGTAAVAVLGGARERWAQEVLRRQGQGQDWLAYATGGADLVEQLAEERVEEGGGA